MKDWLKKVLKQKEEARSALKDKVAKSESIEEVRSIGVQIESIDAEITEIRQQLDTMPDEPVAGGNTPPGAAGEQRGVQSQANGNPGFAQVLASFGLQQTPQQRSDEPEDRTSTLEYRKAFMKFAKTGEMSQELRANTMTTTSDVSAVIPSTILDEVIKKMKVYGQVFSQVRKLSVKGGVNVPILSLKPTATWIGENGSSDKQKTQANQNVTFSYFGLECKVSASLLADTVSLDSFESTIIDLITEAMIKAIDLAIIKGSGTGQPLGITVDPRVPSGNVVTLSSANFTSWVEWKKKVFAKMPLAYKAGATFLMASGTFEGYIDGMVDANGQPIGRVNYGITNGPQERFGGKEVILVEDDIIANYDDATTGDVVAVFCNLKDYAINSNMQMTMFRYLDHDTNEWVDKAILIADGKILDPNGVVIVKKGA